jgi:5-methylcytosine-specific restriction endonuclease McrA
VGGRCLDCEAKTQRQGRSGPHPKRCDPCSLSFKRARCRAATAAYRQRNPGIGKASYKVWYDRNAEKKRADALAWYWGNVERAKITNSTWYRDNGDKSRAKSQRRRAVKRGAEAETFLPAEIYERDAWACQLCGEPVDPVLPHPDLMSASLDHRIPLIAGGPHTRANVQLAHLVCNIEKGVRLPA